MHVENLLELKTLQILSLMEYPEAFIEIWSLYMPDKFIINYDWHKIKIPHLICKKK